MLDLSGSLTLPFLGVPCSQTPPRSPTTSPLAVAYCCLPGFRPCRPADKSHEAQSLHLRYGPSVALPTLSPCRYLHEPKARFPVGRLIPLAGAGIAPAGSARITLTHRKSSGCPRLKCSSPFCW